MARAPTKVSIRNSGSSIDNKKSLQREEPSDADTECSVIPNNIRVIGMTHEGNGTERKVVIIANSNGRSRTNYLSLAELAIGDRKALATLLVENGYISIDGQALKRISAAILKKAHDEDVIVLCTQGRHEIEIGGGTYTCHVWRNRVYWHGQKPPRTVKVAIKNSPKPASCDLATWHEKVASKLSGNPYMIVVHAHALAALLRREFGQPRTSISLVGPSGVGKSTVQQSAQSLIGHVDDVRSMSGTKVGLLEYLYDHPDSPVFFQDIRQTDSPDTFIDLVFDIAEGAGRIRSGQTHGNELSATMILSNERLAADMVMSKRGALDEGLYSRLLEIVCNAKYGAFHNLHGCKYADEFAKELSRNSSTYFGAAWTSWNSALAESWEKVVGYHESALPTITAKISALVGKTAHNRVNNRILDSLSFSAWAGVVASKLKILPLDRNEIIDAFGLVFREHIDRQISGTTPLSEQIISEVRGCLDENTHRFVDLRSFNDEKKQSPIYGYRFKSKRHGELNLFLPSVFDRLFVKNYGSVVFKILSDAGLLIVTNGRGNQYQVRVPGIAERKSFVAIREDVRFD